jgi:hypothetical protein
MPTGACRTIFRTFCSLAFSRSMASCFSEVSSLQFLLRDHEGIIGRGELLVQGLAFFVDSHKFFVHRKLVLLYLRTMPVTSKTKASMPSIFLPLVAPRLVIETEVSIMRRPAFIFSYRYQQLFDLTSFAGAVNV